MAPTWAVPGLFVNTTYTNPSFKTITSRTLSEPPLPTFPKNPLIYNLPSADTSNTHQPLSPPLKNNHINTSIQKPLFTSHSFGHTQNTLHSNNFHIPHASSPNKRTSTFFTLLLSKHLQTYTKYILTLQTTIIKQCIYSTFTYRIKSNIYKLIYFYFRTP